MKFSVKPHSQTAMNAAMAEVGRLVAVISVERHELRNRYTTKIVRPAPRVSAWITLFRLSCALSPPSYVTSRCVPSGSVLLISATMARTRLATDTVLASRERLTNKPTFGWALRRLKLLRSAKPSTVRRNLREPHDLVALPLDDDLAELGRRFDAPDEADALVLERTDDATDRRVGVGGLDGGDDVRDADIELAHAVGLEQDRQLALERARHLHESRRLRHRAACRPDRPRPAGRFRPATAASTTARGS